ncbi:MAG: ATP-binding protein [Myxococcota bacterium]
MSESHLRLPRAFHLGDALAAVMDSIPALVFLKDANNQILYANHAVAEAMATTPEAMVGTASERWYPAEHAERYFADDLEVMRSGRPQLGIEEPKRTHSGEIRLQTDKFPVFDDADNPVGILVIARDTTHESQDPGQSARLATVGRLAAGVAHNVNNALTLLLGQIDVAEQALQSDDDPTAALELARNAIRKTTASTRKLMSIAQPHPVAPTWQAPNEILREVAALLGGALSNVELRVSLDNDVPPLCVDADGLLEVFVNLALNARDAMPEGGTLQFLSRLLPATASEPARVRLSVADTGTGIPEALRPTLFEPFVKGSGSHGHGLGLASARALVEDQGGELSFETQTGRGTTFHVTLPVPTEDG